MRDDLRRPFQEIPQRIHVDLRPDGPRGHIIPGADAGKHAQRPAEFPLDAEADIGIDAIADHARALTAHLELALDRIHHSLTRLAQRQRLAAAQHADQRGAGGRAGAGEQRAGRGQRGVDVGGQEGGPVVADVVVRDRQLQVVDVEIQTAEHDADRGVDQLGIRAGDQAVVFRGDVSPEGGVGAADEGYVLRLQFGFDPAFAQDEDFRSRGVVVRLLGQDAGYVDGGGVGGAEDLGDGGGDGEGC